MQKTATKPKKNMFNFDLSSPSFVCQKILSSSINNTDLYKKIEKIDKINIKYPYYYKLLTIIDINQYGIPYSIEKV